MLAGVLLHRVLARMRHEETRLRGHRRVLLLLRRRLLLRIRRCLGLGHGRRVLLGRLLLRVVHLLLALLNLRRRSAIHAVFVRGRRY